MTGVDGGLRGLILSCAGMSVLAQGGWRRGGESAVGSRPGEGASLASARGSGMGCGRAHGEMPPNTLVSPSFQPHLHGAGGMWALPAEMVSAVHALLCLARCPVPALPDLLAVLKEWRRGRICPGTSAHQP